MDVLGQIVERLGNVGGQRAAGGPLLGDGLSLGLGGHVAGDQQPEETLGQGFSATGGLGQELLALGDGLAAEADALLGVEDRGLPHQTLDTPHAAVHLRMKQEVVINSGFELVLDDDANGITIRRKNDMLQFGVRRRQFDAALSTVTFINSYNVGDCATMNNSYCSVPLYTYNVYHIHFSPSKNYTIRKI